MNGRASRKLQQGMMQELLTGSIRLVGVTSANPNALEDFVISMAAEQHWIAEAPQDPHHFSMVMMPTPFRMTIPVPKALLSFCRRSKIRVALAGSASRG